MDYEEVELLVKADMEGKKNEKPKDDSYTLEARRKAKELLK